MAKRVGDEVVGVFGDFVLGEEVDGGDDEAGADEPEGCGSEDFEDGVEALEDDAEAEEEFAKAGAVLEEGGELHGGCGVRCREMEGGIARLGGIRRATLVRNRHCCVHYGRDIVHLGEKEA